jgi:dTDP-4-amino-4,6-dideoxygalactose transaminase
VNVLAAMGVAQMELLPSFIKRKKEIAEFYKNALSGIEDISFQKIDEDVDCNMWLFTIMTDKQKEVLKILNDNQLQSRPFWVPMNQLRMFKEDIYYTKEDKSNFIYQRCLSIPCSTNITDEEMTRVADKIKSVY